MPSKKLTGSQLRKFRSDVAKLKAKGLVSARVDARKQKATRHMRETIAQYKDVLEGNAQVVRLPKKREAKAFADKFRVKNGRVVIPANKTERVRYNKKTHEITSTSIKRGKKITKHYTSTNFEAMIKLPTLGKHRLYRIAFGGGQIWTFDTATDLINFMHPYEKNPRNPFRDWEKYVEVVTIDEAEA